LSKTKELLVRSVVAIGPDGNSTTVTEHWNVVIDWLGEKPGFSNAYAILGDWRLSTTNQKVFEVER